MQHTWSKWRLTPPPAGVEIVGSWDDPPEKEGAMHNAGKRCKRGCCFDSPVCGSLVPPIWWRLADLNEDD